MRYDRTLQPRGMKDYEDTPLQRTKSREGRRAREGQRDRENQHVAAVTTVYSELIQAVTMALKTGQSVFIACPPELTRPLVQAIKGCANTSSFYHFSIKDVISANQMMMDAEVDTPVIQLPAHELISGSFEPFLLRPQNRELIGVLDFLDSICSVPGENLQDFLCLLNEYPDFQWLGFAHPRTPLPPSLLSRFQYRFSVPPLRRDQIWSLLTYAEAQGLFGANILSIAAQASLYHAAAGMNTSIFRSFIETLAAENVPLVQPSEAVHRFREFAAGGVLASPVDLPEEYTDAARTLNERIVQPFQQYSSPDLTAVHLEELDREIPHGVLCYGEMGQAEILAEWLAGQLKARYLRVYGAGLARATRLFDEVYPLPAVVQVQDMDVALLQDAAGIRALLESWDTFPSDLPLFIFANLVEGVSLPAYLARRFSLALSLP